MQNKLRVLRAQHNLTQEQLAQKVDVTRQTINAIEKGKYLPSLTLAFALSKVFNLPIEQIFSSNLQEVKNA